MPCFPPSHLPPEPPCWPNSVNIGAAYLLLSVAHLGQRESLHWPKAPWAGADVHCSPGPMQWAPDCALCHSSRKLCIHFTSSHWFWFFFLKKPCSHFLQQAELFGVSQQEPRFLPVQASPVILPVLITHKLLALCDDINTSGSDNGDSHSAEGGICLNYPNNQAINLPLFGLA